jgi:hypothetical protein
MKLNVPFKIEIQTIKIRENYTGSITLSPKGATSKTYHFMVLNPYKGKEAEFSIYEDEEKKRVFAEGIGVPKQGYNPRSGLPITAFDFSLGTNDPKTGLVWVLSQIISEGIYQTEISGKWHKTEFEHYWEQDFSDSSLRIAESFLASFGL